ncbi:hypothetical protein LCGC14_2298070 [marine sediment metagenome]|uniref:Uncharacterized protein n=1 Tax=marine sediment metagenome TaxID=412755 RepID=A0A0F9FJB0_9ZZZZ
MGMKPKTVSLTPDEVQAVIRALNYRFCWFELERGDGLVANLPEMDLIDDVIDKLKEN